MISVEEAAHTISKNCQTIEAKSVSLSEATGCILREDVVADRDYPPHDRSTMDGIAIQFQVFTKKIRTFRIAGVQKAGIPAQFLEREEECFEIMTGALVPTNCDCVIPVEDITVDNGIAHINNIVVEQWQFIHRKANDFHKGEILLKEGCIISPQHIAVAAAVGHSSLMINRQAKIAAVGTGDEVVPVDGPVYSYQVRESNVYAIQAALVKNRFPLVSIFHIRDEKKVLLHSLSDILSKHDVIIISGGISKGKFDFIPDVLNELEIGFLFKKVNQRPGGPFGFAVSKDKKPIFTLPGNPVSTQVCTLRYVLPYLYQHAGCNVSATEFAVLKEEIRSNNTKTNFVPVVLSSDEKGCLCAEPVHLTTSGNFASLPQTHGFLELPQDAKTYPRGMRARLFRW